MLVEVTRELAKCVEDAAIPSDTVLAWLKKVETQRVQTGVISSLCESRNFEAITHKEVRLGNKRHASNTVITTKKCMYCRQEHKPG